MITRIRSTRGTDQFIGFIDIVTCCDGSDQKVPMAILSDEVFFQNFEFLRSAIFRQSKLHISAKNYPIDLRLVFNES